MVGLLTVNVPVPNPAIPLLGITECTGNFRSQEKLYADTRHQQTATRPGAPRRRGGVEGSPGERPVHSRRQRGRTSLSERHTHEGLDAVRVYFYDTLEKAKRHAGKQLGGFGGRGWREGLPSKGRRDRAEGWNCPVRFCRGAGRATHSETQSASH